MQVSHYCEHFKNLRFTKTVDIGQQPSCKYCLIGKNYLWYCLAKNCGYLVCDRNNKEHIKMHLECTMSSQLESKTKKSFHSIFINVLTAQIICIHCNIEIYDLQKQMFGQSVQKANKKLNRLKILTYTDQKYCHLFLSLINKKAKVQNCNKIVMGQLENSEGHRKISKALTGFFGDKKNHAVNSALQFLMQFQLFRDIVLSAKPFTKYDVVNADKQKKWLKFSIKHKRLTFGPYKRMQNFIQRSQELIKLLIHESPSILGYKRKDPFEHVINFMTKVHEYIKYYTLDYEDSEYDEWDLLGNPATASKLILNCPLFDNTSITLSLNYACKKCERQQSLPAHLNFLKLNFPKKKRKVKQIEKQLAEHRFSSPVKNRRKSLVSLFKKEEQCPFTIAELIIEFLKQPIHKDKICSMCKQPMQKMKLHFESLPQYLIIQVNRMGNDGNSVDQTNIEFSTDPIDFGPFTSNKSDSIVYNFQTALCVQTLCSYPVVAFSKFNKQTYIFKNQNVSMLKLEKNPPNPYVICYKRQCPGRDNTKLKDCYHNIQSSVEVEQQVEKVMQKQGLYLPDFWLCQLKQLIPQPLINQRVCKHRKLRPHIQSKMKKQQKIPTQVYDYLTQTFRGRRYTPQQCNQCLSEIQKIKERKKVQKQKIIEYQKLKSTCYCMVSNIWLKKWMNFLYGKGTLGYLSKGHPMPGPIDNKTLLDGQKCRSNLQKNEDYKVLNVFIWKFLKQLYGGGPQIRYKWNKNQITQIEEQKVKEIRKVASQIKQIYSLQYVESPKKTSMIIEKTTSFVQSVRGSQDAEQLSMPEEVSP